MNKRTYTNYFVLLPLLFTLLLSACGTTTAHKTAMTVKPIPTAIPTAEAIDSLVQDSIFTTDQSAPGHTQENSNEQENMPALPSIQNIMTMEASSDYSSQALTLTYLKNSTRNGSQTTQTDIEEITDVHNWPDETIYTKNLAKSDTWHFQQITMPLATNTLNPPSAEQKIMDMLALARDAGMKDLGHENVNGTQLRHISAQPNATQMHQLLSNNMGPIINQLLQSNSSMDPQTASKITTFINSAKVDKSDIQIWIDDLAPKFKHYVTRIDTQYDVTFDMSPLLTPNEAAAIGDTTIHVVLNDSEQYSKYNQPANITLPKNATPATNNNSSPSPLQNI